MANQLDRFWRLSTVDLKAVKDASTPSLSARWHNILTLVDITQNAAVDP